MRRLRGCDESGRGARAASEKADVEVRRLRVLPRPADRFCNAGAEQRNVENIGSLGRLVLRQQIEEQCGKPPAVQLMSHVGVAGTEPARPATVGKDDKPDCVLWNPENAFEVMTADLNSRFACLLELSHGGLTGCSWRLDRIA